MAPQHQQRSLCLEHRVAVMFCVGQLVLLPLQLQAEEVEKEATLVARRHHSIVELVLWFII